MRVNYILAGVAFSICTYFTYILFVKTVNYIIAPSDTEFFNAGRKLADAVESSQTKTLEHAELLGKVREFKAQGNILPYVTGIPFVFRRTQYKEIRSKYSWDFSTTYTMDGIAFETIEFTPFRLLPITPRALNFSEQCDPLLSNYECSVEMDQPIFVIPNISLQNMNDVLDIYSTVFEYVDERSYLTVRIWNYFLGVTTFAGIEKTESRLAIGKTIIAVGKLIKTGDHQYTFVAPTLSNSSESIKTVSTVGRLRKTGDHQYNIVASTLLNFSKETQKVVDQDPKFIYLLMLVSNGVAIFLVFFGKMKNFFFSRNDAVKDVPIGAGDVRHDDRQPLCVICEESPRNVVLLDCHHFCLCEDCSKILRGRNEHCPVCRQIVRESMKVFVS